MQSLFVYGTLGPGRPNAHIMEAIGGSWEEGSVGGTLLNEGWGAEMGYPGIVLDNSGNRVKGFCSVQLTSSTTGRLSMRLKVRVMNEWRSASPPPAAKPSIRLSTC
ncbi:Uncharacterised protein [Serratia marcescens]|nr:Uncharacterised protein [Serratia marcescens]CVB23430.1 Uncharacterised protein [Serratia marcescens]CVB87125.1 Uncharacterised protein [Serratia marcescens]CVC09957.1 Uncharacterised protein [Serratia marcescens]CVD01842.1 Uncharacterised protein [Serratia marcescens]